MPDRAIDFSMIVDAGSETFDIRLERLRPSLGLQHEQTRQLAPVGMLHASNDG